VTKQLKVLVGHRVDSVELTRLIENFPQVEFFRLPADGVVPPEHADAEVLFRCAMPQAAMLETLKTAPKLRWIQTCTAGFDWMLSPEVIAGGYLITRTAYSANTTIAEYTLGYMLMMTKQFPRVLNDQANHFWNPQESQELAGCTVGIIGAGAIGSEIAKRCLAFDMKVIGTRRTPRATPYIEDLRGSDALEDVLAEADFVVLSCPLTPETRGMIGETQLRLMKPTAYLINIARGPLVREQALMQALHEGWIAGAALDVFDQEPLPADHPLWDTPRTIITPHCSYRTPKGMQRIVAEFQANLSRYLAGEELLNQLGDPTLGY
jgi:phosphoglycerate dehydrogenase-like enzyme